MNGYALVMLDMTKAFDSVYHARLIAVLETYGISSNLLQWFRDYLFERSQLVKLDHWHCSELRQVRIGVPQGSILGPNLFSMFTADIREVPKSATLHAFADDVQLYIHLNVLNAQVA